MLQPDKPGGSLPRGDLVLDFFVAGAGKDALAHQFVLAGVRPGMDDPPRLRSDFKQFRRRAAQNHFALLGA